MLLTFFRLYQVLGLGLLPVDASEAISCHSFNIKLNKLKISSLFEDTFPANRLDDFSGLWLKRMRSSTVRIL